MTNEQIIELAKRASEIRGDVYAAFDVEELQRFAQLVRNEVLEEAALCADDHKKQCYEKDIDWYEAGRIAAAIREMKK